MAALGFFRFFALGVAVAVGVQCPAFEKIGGEQIAKDANKIIGTKYVWGGNSNTKGLDCSALVKNVYRKYGYRLPRKASWQAQSTKYCPTYHELSDISIGDALYFKNAKKGIHHTAIVTGFAKDGTPIITHAKGKKFGVVREKMSSRYIRELFAVKKFYECTSPLAGVYTDEEIASIIVKEAKSRGVSPYVLFRDAERLSSVDPLLVSLPIAKNKRIGHNVDALMGLASDGLSVTKVGDTVKFRPATISDARLLIRTLYEYGFNFSVGLFQIDVERAQRLSGKESGFDPASLLYPAQNAALYER